MPLPLITALALALAGTPDPYEVGLDRYRQADYLAASVAFREAVARPASPELEARANLWLGVCLFNINESDAARLAFKSALLGDRTLTLPDDAPPTAQPLFDDVRRSLPPVATRPPTAAVPAPGPTAPTAPAVVARAAEPAAATSPATPPAHTEVPSTERVEEPESESGPWLRPWMAGAALGVAGGLGVAAGGLEVGSYTNFNAATDARYASTAHQLVLRGSSEQNSARIMGVAAASTAVIAIVLFVLAR